MPRKGSSFNAIQACGTNGTLSAGFAGQEGNTRTPGALNGAGAEKTAEQCFDQLSRLCQKLKINKSYSPTVLSTLDPLSRMPKRFDIIIHITDHMITVTWTFSHRRTMTGMWLKREMSEQLGIDLSRYLLQTAGSLVDDSAWLIAVGVQPGSVLTLTRANPNQGDTDSSSSIKASENYLRFCREQDSEYAMMLESLQAHCQLHGTTPKRVGKRFCIVEIDQLGEVVDLKEMVDLQQLD